MQPILDIVAPVFGLGLLGYAAARLGWFPDRAAEGLARFVFDFAVPLMLLRTFAQTRLPESFPWQPLVSFYGPAAGLYALGLAVSSRAFGRDFMAQVITGFGCTFGNSILLGLPLALSTFGAEGMVPFFILLSVHGLAYLTVTTALLEYGRHHGQPPGRLALGVARGLATNPIVLGLVAGVVLNRTGMALPGPVDRSLESMQAAVSPCALFSLGASLTRYGIAGSLAESVFVVSVKNLLMPLAAGSVAHYLFDAPGIWVMSVTLLAAQPTGVNVYLFAERYAAGRELATSAVFLSTSLSLLSIPAPLLLYRQLS